MSADPLNENDRKDMKLSGVPASPGYAIGAARLYVNEEMDIESFTIRSGEELQHINEYKKARSRLEQELNELKDEQEDEETSKIIEAQIEMVNDPELEDRIEGLINEELYSAEYAIRKAFDSYIDLLSVSDNSQMRERTVDVTDIRDRMLEIIRDDSDARSFDSDSIVVARDLSPRQVIHLIKYDIAGLVVESGGPTSHAAIIARSVGLPAIMGVKKAAKVIKEDTQLALDAVEGRVILQPDEGTLDEFRRSIQKREERQKELQHIASQSSETKDGEPFVLRANIEFREELGHVRQVRAEGIGLLRAESIYLGEKHFQDEERQLSFYHSIMEGTGEHPVTIRLFDAGGDKIIEDKKKEDNPFLGWRGIRMLLDEKELLHDQLRALLKTAGRYPGRLNILVPMVTVIDEVIELKKELSLIFKELNEQGIELDEEPPLGLMVEVPSVAVRPKEFISEVDFVSIGTNDLTQYTLAVDRGNELISHLYDQRHPAVWHLIQRTAQEAHAQDKPITVCGELASDPVSAACLLGMGITELSMTPSRIPQVKELLCNKRMEEMQSLADRALECTTASEVNELFNNWI
ncbi:MAG: phosphoenolpyruvate--protein phosphotransferase [Balneolaceae bacterium]|nr:phosphoenolpyruvate--protein phosphotransferase [Balneolaceae bacterium]